MRAARVSAAVALLGIAGCASHPHAPPPARRTPAPSAAPVTRAATSPDANVAVRRLGRSGRPVYCGARRGHLVALTFDDGPGRYTPLALRELRAAGARATFFLVARSIASFPAWPRRERRLAAIGDHTGTHPYLPSLSLAAAKAEIEAGRAAARRAAGGPVDLFRPPYGADTPAIRRELRRLGLTEILWDVDSGDSRIDVPQDFHAITATVARRIRPGSIVLFHENRGQTIRALRTILPDLHRRGLRAVTVPELLAADPPTPAMLRAGPRACGSRVLDGSAS
jgi:peptidoglycan/xylan/chitin deacetylase (PgdA/CDA1 family)